MRCNRTAVSSGGVTEFHERQGDVRELQ